MSNASLKFFVSRFPRRSGSALLLILGCVALLTIVILAFFSQARSEAGTSNFYARETSTKLLSENVINLVEAQLREGARSIDINTGVPVAWASQPGMIRTYNSTGNPYKYFKLFSWDNMVGTGQFDETSNQIPVGSTGWSSQPNIYTDLNEPVNNIYPILDPAAAGVVEGFSYTAQTDTANPLPMPVKWLYVLKDGTVTTATQAAGTSVQIPNAGSNNPVVGRVAFWTDDETCKVNINTAAEGSFWDLPYANTYEELGNNKESAPYGYSTSVPSGEEFQRMPGHPATTSLSAVFGNGTFPILPDTGLDANGPKFPLTTATYTATFAPYYSLTPRYAAGGSMGGAEPAFGTNPAYALPFILPSYRLYNSVDELAFDPSRLPLASSNAVLYPPTIGGNATGINPSGRQALTITPSIIQQRRFFLTAESRAPEETLFGTPRISLWPIQAQKVARTAKDNLLAFCSTVGGEPYYFQRATYYQYLPQGASSPTTTVDANNTPTSSSQSTTQDFPGPPTTTLVTPGDGNVARNENLYAYLQALTNDDKSIPGFGGNLLDKYPGNGGTSDRDEILTEMFDLIRSGVNTMNISPNIYPNYTYSLYQANASSEWFGGIQPGASSVLPIAISSNGGHVPNTHGLGRTYGIAEVALGFMVSQDVHGAPGIDLAGSAAGTYAADYSSPLAPATTLRRMSIGVGLPWACEEDYYYGATGTYLYFDTATSSYGNYYIKNVLGTYTAYVYPATTPAVQLPTTAEPVPIFCYWDKGATPPAYGSYFVAPSGAPNAGKFVVCTSPQAIPPPTPPNTLPPSPPYPFPAGSGLLPSTAVTIGDPQTTTVRSYLVVRPYCLLEGVPQVAPTLRIRITNLDQLTLNGAPLQFPGAGSAVVDYNSFGNTSEYTSGGLLETWIASNCTGWPWLGPTHQSGPNPGTLSGSTWGNYPFYSSPISVAAAYPSPFGGEDQSPRLTNPGGPIPSSAVPPPQPVQIHNLVKTVGSADRTVNNFAASTMNLNGTSLKIEIFDGQTPSITGAQLVQTLYVNVPAMTLPVPSIEMSNGEGTALESSNDGLPGGGNVSGPRIPGYGGNPSGTPPATTYQAPSTAVPNPNPINNYPPLTYYWQENFNPMDLLNQRIGTTNVIYRGDVVRSFVPNPNSSMEGDMRLLAANPMRPQPTGYSLTNPALNLNSDDFIPLGSAAGSNYLNPTQGPYTSPFIRMLHSLFSDAGDGRNIVLTLMQTGMEPLTVVSQLPFAGYPTTVPPNTSALPMGILYPMGLNGSWGGNFSAGIGETNGALFTGEYCAGAAAPVVTPELTGAFIDGPGGSIPGDWTDGLGPSGDGPFIMKPDEAAQGDNGGQYSNNYFQSNQNIDKSATSFSPNRQITSPIIFGTLPSRALQGVPWCTLLFCPNPAANDANKVHPGFGTGSGTAGPNDVAPYVASGPPYYGGPPDHLFLDLFWMPVVEPYAISEPFSTAGKVNLNYEIVPFGFMNGQAYVHRSTALHAVMKSTRILAIPTHADDGSPPPPALPAQPQDVSPNAKSYNLTNDLPSDASASFSFRYGINLAATLGDPLKTATNTNYQASAFYQRFLGTKPDIFRSASEICNIFLVPQAVPGASYFSNAGSPTLPALPTDGSYASMQNWWQNFKLTGDNGRESPYNQVYPRLTTKSNTFQIHMRVQILSQTRADQASGTFNPAGGDSIAGEARGSAIVERYLDPNQTSPTLPDFATSFAANPTGLTSTVDSYVRYRVVSMHAFSP